MDRTVIDSFRAERSDSRDYDTVPAERLRHDRQAEAVLSIVSFRPRKPKERSQDVAGSSSNRRDGHHRCWNNAADTYKG